MDKRSSISDLEGRDWVASLRDRWRLQILSRRLKRNADGTASEIPARIRRFVEGIPWGHVKPAIDALLAASPYTGVIANGVDFGEPYRPTLTVWQRDAQSAAAGAVRQDATYTLIQDLVEASDRDGYAIGSSSSCSEEVTADYVWDAPGVEPLPEGGQGVTYSIAAMRRNDDGTFDYQVVKRVAKTQHVEPVTVRDDAQSKVTQELWDNVYVLPDGSYADETGSRVFVPQAGVSDGVSTRIEGLSENPDCTLKFQVVRETSKDAGVRSSCKKTMFEHEHGSVVSGQVASPEHVKDAGGGHYEEVDGQLQPDGTYTVTSRYTDEKEQVSGKEYRRTPRALITTVTTRNTPSKASEPSAPGGRQSHEMTDGGRYNLSVTTVTPGKTPDSARCVATVFEETDDAVAMKSSIQKAHFAAGSGKYGEIVQDMDEYGVVKQVTRTTVEKQQNAAAADYRKTTRATISTVTTRNGGTVARPPARPGERQSHEMTPGGKYNLTVTTVSANGEPDSARDSATVFESVHDAVRMTRAIAAAVPRAGGGVYEEIVQDMDEYGVVKQVTRTTVEKQQNAAAADYRKTTRATISTVTTRNGGTVARPPSRPGERQSHEMTPGGKYNLTVTTVSANGEPDSARKAVNAFEEVDDSVSMSRTLNSSRRPSGTGSGGRYGEVVQDMDEYGVVKTVDRTTTEKRQAAASKDIRKTTRATITTTVDRNVGTQAQPPQHVGERQSHEMTPGGLYNFTKVTVSTDGKPDSARKAVNAFEEVVDAVSMSKTLDTAKSPAGTGSGGRYGEVVQDMDEYGVVKTVDRTTTEKPHMFVTSVDARLDGLVKTTVNRFQPSKMSEEGLSVGTSVRNEMTPGGQWNQTKTELVDKDRGKLKEECEQTYLVHVHEDLDGKGTAKPEQVEHSFVKGEIVVKENVLTQAGAWNVRKVVRSSKKRERELHWEDKIVTGTTETKYKCFMLVFRNWDEPPDPGDYDDYEHKDLSFQINEFGQYDGVLTCRKFLEYAQRQAGDPGTGGMTYEGDIVVHKGGREEYVHFTIYRNAHGVISSGFLADAHDYPELGLHSSDNGTLGIKYGPSERSRPET